MSLLLRSIRRLPCIPARYPGFGSSLGTRTFRVSTAGMVVEGTSAKRKWSSASPGGISIKSEELALGVLEEKARPRQFWEREIPDSEAELSDAEDAILEDIFLRSREIPDSDYEGSHLGSGDNGSAIRAGMKGTRFGAGMKGKGFVQILEGVGGEVRYRTPFQRRMIGDENSVEVDTKGSEEVGYRSPSQRKTRRKKEFVEVTPGIEEDAKPLAQMSFGSRLMAEQAQSTGQSRGKRGHGRKKAVKVEEEPEEMEELAGEVNKIQLTAAQQAVVEMAVNGDNIFLTGAAGSGKTAVLKEIIYRLNLKYKTKNKQYPAIQVTAPTGIAALQYANLPFGGKTIWRFAGWNTNSFHQTLDDILKDAKATIRRTMRDTKVLIIDEISMVENHFLERLNLYMQRILDSSEPFGGKQVIIVGDFHQLPPVKPFECCIECGEPMEPKLEGPICTTSWCSIARDEIGLKWGDKWAFKAPVWKKLHLKHIKLEQIHRQKDMRFQDTLNKIRNGIPLTEGEWKELEVPKVLPEGVRPIRLMSRVNQVRSYNSNQIAVLKTPPKTWAAQDVCRKESTRESDNPNTVARKQREYLEALATDRFETGLTLKVGAKVLLLYNLVPERGLVNGSTGEVVGFVNAEKWTINVPEGDNKKWRQERVEEFHGVNPWRPIVKFSNGYTMAIEPICAESVRGRSTDRYLLSRTQIPLTLGWALSIHKSQGMTLDYVELSSRDIFESGQLYVGLSRATKLEGLTLTGFNRKQLSMDPEVLGFYGRSDWVELGEGERCEV